MTVYVGTRQMSLRRITCHWGDDRQTHAALIPFFREDYKVFGMLGFSLGTPPVWYPSVPLNAEGGHCRFKDSETEKPPALGDLEPGLFQGAFYFDPWRVVAPAFRAGEGFPDFNSTVNLAVRTIQRRPIVDVLLERHLHRVRGLVLKRGLLRSRAISVLTIPPLAKALDPVVEGREKRLGGEGASALRRGGITERLMRILAGPKAQTFSPEAPAIPPVKENKLQKILQLRDQIGSDY
ncbi:MAG: hypothetical protein IIA14_13920 [SAR324 cluster bacterium]|nr:hypothetical protein [SAR324 cluster bacterium]